MVAVERAVYGRQFPDGEPTDLSRIASPHAVLPLSRLCRHGRPSQWFAANNVGTFGVDLWASDWVKMTPGGGVEIESSPGSKSIKRGMLLFHDIYPWTAEMMPRFLAN